MLILSAAMTKYHYDLIPPEAKQVYRPLLPIKLEYPPTKKCTPPIRALIDSGADVCMCTLEVGLWLGITFDGTEDEFSIETANGSLSRAVKKTVTLITDKNQFECPFFFVEGINPLKIPLLGQQGFFDHYKVCFDREHKTFEIF
jgi:hypothetical protein